MRETNFDSIEVPVTRSIGCRIIDPAGPAPSDRPRPLLLALHGMAMDASKFHRILRHLEVAEMIVAIPDATYAYEDRSSKPPTIVRSWYHYDGDQPGFRRGLEEAESHLLDLCDRIESVRKIDRERSVVLGFSQGGYLAGFVGLRNPDRFGGTVIASARLKHEFLGDEIAAHSPTVLFVHSDKDAATPSSAIEEGRRRLEAAGTPSELITHGDGHRLPPDALLEVGVWLGKKGFDGGQTERRELDKVWGAIDQRDSSRAIELAARLFDTSVAVEARLATGIAQLDADRPRAAVETLEAIDPTALEGDAEFLRRFHLGQALWEIGEPDRAIDLISPIEPEDPIERANLEYWRGLCYDLKGDTKRADVHFSAARSFDPEGAPEAASIDPDAALALVEKALVDLPAKIRDLLAEVPIIIEDMPSLSTIRSSMGKDGPAVRADTLGLYSGHDLTERSNLEGGLETATIHIFRRNLERFAVDAADLEEQVRITLLHELGHHLGLDEDDVDALGLG